ncbi:GNAT family N-acetyltransferase, partial [Streptomyces prunicolor]|uniref:GNAT family N-acetyltransferase n=1 Tax=Streptomyces prunicolor TaxID=67348 RepID=UPI0033F9F394
PRAAAPAAARPAPSWAKKAPPKSKAAVRQAGTVDWAGFDVERKQGHVVGVFVRPEVRGIGLTEVLFDAALEWAWGRGVERVRLIVHEDNERARRFYGKVGFVPTGVVVPLAGNPDEREVEMAVERP